MQASRATGGTPDHCGIKLFLRKTARSAHHPQPEPCLSLSLRSPVKPGEVSGQSRHRRDAGSFRGEIPVDEGFGKVVMPAQAGIFKPMSSAPEAGMDSRLRGRCFAALTALGKS
jgi:hypothetical protein